MQLGELVGETVGARVSSQHALRHSVAYGGAKLRSYPGMAVSSQASRIVRLLTRSVPSQSIKFVYPSHVTVGATEGADPDGEMVGTEVVGGTVGDTVGAQLSWKPQHVVPHHAPSSGNRQQSSVAAVAVLLFERVNKASQ